MYLCSVFILFIFIFISVAFVTMSELKVLGYIQLRRGPNSLGLGGLLEPMSDGFKLFLSEQVFVYTSNFLIYYGAPVFMLGLSFVLWCLFPFLVNTIEFSLGILYFLCCSGLKVYGILLSGWSSGSKYAFLGSMRALAQTISYEVSLALLIISLLFMVHGYDLLLFNLYQQYVWFIVAFFPLFLCLFISCLAETNRSPFDFAEGESELVSGFNIEYGSGGFAFEFLSVYMNIIFMSVIMCVMFMGCLLWSFFFYFKVVLNVFLFIWIRGTLPHLCYDKLMYFSWKVLLPICLGYILFISCSMIFIIVLL